MHPGRPAKKPLYRFSGLVRVTFAPAAAQPSALIFSLCVFGRDFDMWESVLQGCVNSLLASFVSELSQMATLLWSDSQEAKVSLLQ